ncbi:MAG: hypothetical protein GX971_04675 [Firmicutes bacterium]|nr:hypothetical protein [Bacillota bacterium]
MKKLPSLLIGFLVASFVMATPMLGFAQGVSNVTQIGFDNYIYVYQEVLSEVIILQLGDENSSSVDQIGSGHIAGIGQVGEDNEAEIHQLGQGDLVLTMQFGAGNSASITQMHSSAWSFPVGAVSDNDAFSYQSGLYNILNLLQIGDDNTSSIYQIDNNNEAFVVQEQFPLGVGTNAALVVQIGVSNWTSVQQAGAQLFSGSLQLGDDNATLINQQGLDNTVSVFQTGNHNTFTATQG